ncbi:hypothetical protein OG746_37920 [Streptomyces sp. NBC_01016]|uniref:hypothetical protein n=1 Tax=Streptomyces sp. NBC_01016 TaxID=2903720 RepID=UPI00225A0AD7|nr:hypothetical protein [Streptomyces sp. NBC_01016]MCX4834492.1 hypothetical protein [Streptomyces sp. NBC_01016]
MHNRSPQGQFEVGAPRSELHGGSKNSLVSQIRVAVADDKGYSVEDATNLDRATDQTEPRLWKVCFKRPGKAPSSVDFGVVLTGEPCPKKWGERAPAPHTPSLVGDDFAKAYKAVLAMGYPAQDIRVYYGGSAETDRSQLQKVKGQVCKQLPAAEHTFHNPEHVDLFVAVGKCPDRA